MSNPQTSTCHAEVRAAAVTVREACVPDGQLGQEWQVHARGRRGRGGEHIAADAADPRRLPHPAMASKLNCTLDCCLAVCTPEQAVNLDGVQ